jgi:hypothetical protein
MSGFSIFPKGNKSGDCSDFITLKKRQAIVSSMGTNVNRFRQVENKSFTKDALNLGIFQSGLNLYEAERRSYRTIVDEVSAIFNNIDSIPTNTADSFALFNELENTLINRSTSQAVPVESLSVINHYSSIFAANSIPTSTKIYALSTVNIGGNQVVDLNAVATIPTGSSLLIPQSYSIKIQDYFFRTIIDVFGDPQILVTGPTIPSPGSRLNVGSTFPIPGTSPQKMVYFLGAASPGVVIITTLFGPPTITLTVEDPTQKDRGISVFGTDRYVTVEGFEPSEMFINGEYCYFYGLIVPGTNQNVLDGISVIQTEGIPIYFKDSYTKELKSPMTKIDDGPYTFYLVAYDNENYYSTAPFFYNLSQSTSYDTPVVSITANVLPTNPNYTHEITASLTGSEPQLTSLQGVDAYWFGVAFPYSRTDILDPDTILNTTAGAGGTAALQFHIIDKVLPTVKTTFQNGSYTIYTVAFDGITFYASEPYHLYYDVITVPAIPPTPGPTFIDPTVSLFSTVTSLPKGTTTTEAFFTSLDSSLINQPNSLAIPLNNQAIKEHYQDALGMTDLPPLYALATKNISGAQVVSDYALESIPLGAGILIPATQTIVIGDSSYRSSFDGTRHVLTKTIISSALVETIFPGEQLIVTGTGLPNDIVFTNVGGGSSVVVTGGNFTCNKFVDAVQLYSSSSSANWVAVTRDKKSPVYAFRGDEVYKYDPAANKWDISQDISLGLFAIQGGNTQTFLSASSSVDGSRVIVCTSDLVAITTDGANFARKVVRDGNNTISGFSSVAVSSDSSTFYVSKANGFIYKSFDNGNNWFRTKARSDKWTKIATNLEGQLIAAIWYTSDINTGIAVSTDFGSTFYYNNLIGKLTSLEVTSNSTILVGQDSITSYIKRSVDGGRSWTDLTQLGQQKWRSISATFNASNIIATTADTGDVYSLSNYDEGTTKNEKINTGTNVPAIGIALINYYGYHVTCFPKSATDRNIYRFVLYDGFTYSDESGTTITGLIGGNGSYTYNPNNTNPPIPTRFPAIPRRVTTIGDSAFRHFDNINGPVRIHAGIKYIGAYAFYGTKITDITFENIRTVLGDYAFANCNSLPVMDIKLYTSDGANGSYTSGIWVFGNSLAGSPVSFYSLPENPPTYVSGSNRSGTTNPVDQQYYSIKCPYTNAQMVAKFPRLDPNHPTNVLNRIPEQRIFFGDIQYHLYMRVVENDNKVPEQKVQWNSTLNRFPQILFKVPDMTKVYNFKIYFKDQDYNPSGKGFLKSKNPALDFFQILFDAADWTRERDISDTFDSAFYLPLTATSLTPILSLNDDLTYTVTNVNVQPTDLGAVPNTSLEIIAVPITKRDLVSTNGKCDRTKFQLNLNLTGGVSMGLRDFTAMLNWTTPNVKIADFIPYLGYQQGLYSVCIGLVINTVYYPSNWIDKPNAYPISLTGTTYDIATTPYRNSYITGYIGTGTATRVKREAYFQVFAVSNSLFNRTKYASSIFSGSDTGRYTGTYATLIEAAPSPYNSACSTFSGTSLDPEFIRKFVNGLSDLSTGSTSYMLIACMVHPSRGDDDVETDIMTRPMTFSQKSIVTVEGKATALNMGIVYNLRVTDVSDKTISLAWEVGSFFASGFYYYYGNSTSPNLTDPTNSRNTNTNCIIRDRTPNTSYTLSVKGWTQDEGFLTLASNYVTVTTKYTLPDAPNNIRYTELTDNSVVLAWNAGSVYFVGYELYLNNSLFRTIEDRNNISNLRLNLSPTTTYSVYVRSYLFQSGTKVFGAQSQTLSFRTKATVINATPPSKPGIVTLSDLVKHREMTLTWTASTGSFLTGYDVYIDGVRVNRSVVNRYTTTCTSETDYVVKVQPFFTDNGNDPAIDTFGPMSDTNTVRTPSVSKFPPTPFLPIPTTGVSSAPGTYNYNPRIVRTRFEKDNGFMIDLGPGKGMGRTRGTWAQYRFTAKWLFKPENNPSGGPFVNSVGIYKSHVMCYLVPFCLPQVYHAQYIKDRRPVNFPGVGSYSSTSSAYHGFPLFDTTQFSRFYDTEIDFLTPEIRTTDFFLSKNDDTPGNRGSLPGWDFGPDYGNTIVYKPTPGLGSYYIYMIADTCEGYDRGDGNPYKFDLNYSIAGIMDKY